jgi:peptidoglycan hydrolase-like amidase
MRLRSLGFAAFAAAAVMQSCQPACTPPVAPPPDTPAPTVPPPPPVPTSLTISGQGNGHGRGLSAWGAYGMAVNEGATWLQIIDKYYGGTSWANTGNRPIGVRLLWADGRPDVTVISRGPGVMWNGAGVYGSMQAFQVGPNLYDVYGASGIGCAGSPIDWAFIERRSGPITFTTALDETNARPEEVLGLCRPDGSVTHYRGTIQALTDGTANRTVNRLLIENYLRGVLPREVPATWGNSAGGAGMNSLWAMAVAARSFAHSQGRYTYAQTCDTDACQVYGGAARRSSVDADTDSVCAEAGNRTYECTNTNRAVRETENVVRVRPGGQIISGEYSATHGPYSSGVNFPAVDDAVSNVAGNPLYTWTRTIAAADLVAKFPQIGTFLGAYSEREPGSTANGVWGNRIVLQGTAGSVTVTNLDFRRAFGFPSHGFSVGSVNS